MNSTGKQVGSYPANYAESPSDGPATRRYKQMLKQDWDDRASGLHHEWGFQQELQRNSSLIEASNAARAEQEAKARP
jgi:hypothetical protein